MSENWYYSTGDGVSHGPMSAAEMLAAAKRGDLAEAGSVYHAEKTSGQWVSPMDIPAIRQAIEGRAAVPKNRARTTAPPVPPPVAEYPPSTAVDILSNRTVLDSGYSFHRIAKFAMLLLTVAYVGAVITIGSYRAIADGTLVFAKIWAFWLFVKYFICLTICFAVWFATKPE